MIWHYYDYDVSLVVMLTRLAPRATGSDLALKSLLRRQKVALLGEMRQLLRVSGRTVFRALDRLGHYTSYSHAGRFYTLREIPTFDVNGLWFCRDVRFSVHGTLRATVVVLVCRAPAGHTHQELGAILGLRVHDTLLSLVEGGLISREPFESLYVYLDPDPERAAAQLRERRRGAAGEGAKGPRPPLDEARVIAVLVAVIRSPRDSSLSISSRLRATGVAVDEEQVEAVFRQYGVKKTAHSRSPRSRR